jgi:flagellar hook-associated protein 1 FlgK
MTLVAALSIANGSLANINRQLAVVSQNIANANTPGYAAEASTQQSLTADGMGLGVHTGATTRNIDTALQGQVLLQNASVAGLQTQQSALAAIDAVQGTPGDGTDLASLLGNLQNQFSTLLNSPDSQPQQSQVVSTAATLANGINALSGAYGTQRQSAQDDLVSAVGTLNTTLATIGQLSNQIIALKVGGQSTADLENQRDAAVQTLSQLVQVKTLAQPNGDMLVITTGGLSLPTRGTGALQASPATLQAGAYYPGGGAPGVTLNGTDITRQLTGGQIGADLTLRDSTLPTFQGELDEFAQNLASRFDAQGLTLFTDPTGAVPAASVTPPVQGPYVGFAGTIQVNAAVTTTPSLVRDGTAAAPTGQAGYTGTIQTVLSYAFGAEQSAGVAQPAFNTTGLGPSGTLAATYAAPPTLGGLASTLVAAQSQASANVTDRLGTQQSLQAALASKLSDGSAVNMDGEMSTMIQLQNSYGISARILSTVQSMWTQLLGAVQS